MPRQPKQPPKPNKIPIPNLRTEDQCDAYIKAEASYLRRLSATRHREKHLVNAATVYMYASFILSVLKRKEAIRLANRRAAEIAASDPNDEPATTVVVQQDGTIGVSK